MPHYPLREFVEMGVPTAARHVILPEYERRGKALECLAPLMMNPHLTPHKVAEASGLNFIEFSLDGWEALHNHLRALEEKAKEVESLKLKFRQLIELVERSNSEIVKAYRETFRES